MSYPKKVPEGWTKGEPVEVWGHGPRYGVSRDLPLGTPASTMDKEIIVEFDSHADCEAWLEWWKNGEPG